MTIKLFNSFILSLILIGCASVDTEKIENLNGGNILKLGHAGLGFTSYINPFNPYPSNGFTAMKKAMEYGADGLEVDLQMTKDSVLVLFHDLKMEESSNLVGCIQEKTWAEIKDGEYKLGSFFDLFQSDKIIRLDSLLSWFQTLNHYPYIHFDTRIGNMCNTESPHEINGAMGPVLLDVLKKYQVPLEKVLVISSSLKFIVFLQSIPLEYPLSYEATSDFESGLKAAIDLGIPSLTVKPKLLTAEKVAEAHSHGIEIVTFGGKSKSGTARLIKLNPDAIHTNNIRAMVDLLDN